MTAPTFPLRFQASLRELAERSAKSDGVSLNQFVNTAVAEKLARDQTAAVFAEMARRGSASSLIAFLDGAPDQPPLFETDEIPADVRQRLAARGAALPDLMEG